MELGVKCFKGRVGLGVDQQNPRWWRDLPSGSIQTLILLLESVGEALAWPLQMRPDLVQLIFKTREADRPITLTQGLYRLWTRVRRSNVASWTRARAGFWDKAVAGSAPLRAALLRQVRLEMATTQSFS